MLYRVAEKSFILIQWSWSATKARRLIQRLKPSHIIVAHVESEESYYLFTSSDALARLAISDDEISAHEVLGLDQRETTPVLDAYADELTAPARAVVVDAGYVIGFIDATVPPSLASKPRGFGEPELASPVARSLLTDFPEAVAVGETKSLLVSVSANMAAGSASIVVPIGTKVDVIVQARKCFEAVGNREGSIAVTDETETTPLQFKFKAMEVGLGIIRIFLYQEGQSLGTVTLESQVVASADDVREQQVRKQEQPLPTIQGAIPDLSLIITEQKVSGETCLTFELRTREPYAGPSIRQPFEPVRLKADLPQYFRDFFKDIETLLPSEAEQYLASCGSDLFKALVPGDLRTLLWSLRSRIYSVQLQSEEAWIPWELCKLEGRENGRLVGGPFMCEAFAMTRWLPALMCKPTLKLNKIALVVPKGSGLSHADSERDYVLSLASGARQAESIPATHEAVTAALASGNYDGWHFTCHGDIDPNRPNRSALQLEQGDSLTPMDLSGEIANLGLAQPLIFLNACQTGQAALSLTGIGGWAEKFLRAASDEDYPQFGAAAFIGAYWSINDEAAHAFARMFYDRLLKTNNTVGEAIQCARLAIRSRSDPTWLAYTVFAHPLAKVQ